MIAAFISPYRADRDRIRTAHREVFHEIWINAPLEICEARDAKGLYKKARAGELKEFTGISARYGPPSAPELEVNTRRNSVDQCLALLVGYVTEKFRLPERGAGRTVRRIR